VIESIRRIYGAVLSATFFMKKNHFFLKINFLLLIMHCSQKKCEKSCDARFFGAKTVLRFFWSFQKKVEKIGKNAGFSKKNLWSQTHFRSISYYHLSYKNVKKMSQKKVSKKRDFIFWNSFLKMKIGHLFLSIFEIKKKVLKTKKLSIFSISPKYSGEVESNRFRLFDKDINYKKILEKSNSCFQTTKNSFCIFWGSFDNSFDNKRNY